MSLIEPNPAPSAMLAVFARWADFAGPSDPSLDTLLHVYPEQHNMQVIYALGLEDLWATGLQNARKVGWRFLAGSGLRQAVAANVTETGNEPPQMTALTRGPEIASAIRAAQRIRDDFPEIKDAPCQYELRVLKIPGILLEVFWLKRYDSDPPPPGNGGGNSDPASTAKTGGDLVVPYFALFCDNLNVMKVLQLDDFLKIAKQLAAERLENSKRTETGKGGVWYPPLNAGYPGKDSGKKPSVGSAKPEDSRKKLSASSVKPKDSRKKK